MILLQSLKNNFSLIGKGFYNYYVIVKYMLDISSPKITSFFRYYLAIAVNHIKNVSLCTLYQTRGVFYER